MCGLAGIIGRIGPANRAALARMNGAMVHRGPDADGFWEAPPDERGFGPMLAHRRLSILDLSPAGAQPMVDPVTGGVVVLNGEIYNYVELREQLAARGHRLQSSGDTAALLRHLALDGVAAVPRLRGMYAFAFWDPAARQLLVARDPLGIKPLYIAANPDPDGEWTVAFASEVRALLASGLLATPKLDPRAVTSVVWNGFTVAPHTAVQGVESFLPGELRVFDARGRETQRTEHWSARATAAEPLDEEAAAAALQECVRLHLASDVPLGVFLSSGIDSSAVANLAQKASQTPVHTFTLAFEEAELNEGVFARRIAEAIGTAHQEVVLTERFFIDRLEAALDSLDQPSFDGLNSYFMSQAVAEAGFKVALVGSGGDELFGGYTSFRDLPRMLSAGRLAGWAPASLRQAFAKRVAAMHHRPDQEFPAQTRWAKLPAMVERADDLVGLYQMAYALFLPDFQRELLAAGSGDVHDGLPATMANRLRGEIAGRSPLSAISTLEQRMFLGERLLRDTDAASMAASIEVRLPLVDQVLFQQMDRLPDATRYQPVRSKALLRRIGLRGLDPKLFDRPKSGFELPFNRWLRSALGSRIDATLRDPQAVAAAGLDPQATQRLWSAFQKGVPGLYWTRIWALFALVHWTQRHRVTI